MYERLGRTVYLCGEDQWPVTNLFVGKGNRSYSRKAEESHRQEAFIRAKRKRTFLLINAHAVFPRHEYCYFALHLSTGVAQFLCSDPSAYSDGVINEEKSPVYFICSSWR